MLKQMFVQLAKHEGRQTAKNYANSANHLTVKLLQRMEMNSVGEIYERLLKEGVVEDQKHFANRLEWSEGYVSQLLSGERKGSRSFNAHLAKGFPETTLRLAANNAKKSVNTGGAKVIVRESHSNTEHVNDYGVRFELQEDGVYKAFHRYVSRLMHESAAAGWGDAEYMKKLPIRTVIVDQPTEDNYLTYMVMDDAQDDGTSDAITQGMEVTGQSYSRDLWGKELPFLPAGRKKKEEGLHAFWILIDRTKGIRLATIKEHDVKNGVLHCVCRSDKKSKYPDFTVRLEDCNQIFFVIAAKKLFG